MATAAPNAEAETLPAQKASSPHAAAQAKYRAKNLDAEREKAKLRMRLLREQRRPPPRPDIYATEEFQEFKEFINKVKPIHVRVNTEDPQEVADFERLLASNPCVETFSVGSDEEVAVFYHLQLRFNRYPEWREELADYRDIIQEYSPEELDQMQLEARARLANKHIILARGGF
ncbi:hypothetical protein B0H11DRAFT_2242354 [Mycena galericulata]|nr:hypothetical protein B0H11DRAFT_2242354 [Mycena galericulata]